MTAERRKVKISGDRSIGSKVHRLAYELEHDAARVEGDHGETYADVANALRALASTMGKLARSIQPNV